MEHRFAAERKAVCAVQEEDVVVNAQIDRRVEALDHRYRAGAGTQPPRPPPQTDLPFDERAPAFELAPPFEPDPPAPDFDS
jgi:hypothetical protein